MLYSKRVLLGSYGFREGRKADFYGPTFLSLKVRVEEEEEENDPKCEDGMGAGGIFPEEKGGEEEEILPKGGKKEKECQKNGKAAFVIKRSFHCHPPPPSTPQGRFRISQSEKKKKTC